MPMNPTAQPQTPYGLLRLPAGYCRVGLAERGWNDLVAHRSAAPLGQAPTARRWARRGEKR